MPNPFADIQAQYMGLIQNRLADLRSKRMEEAANRRAELMAGRVGEGTPIKIQQGNQPGFYYPRSGRVQMLPSGTTFPQGAGTLGTTRSYNDFLLSEAGIDMTTPQGRAQYAGMPVPKRLELYTRYRSGLKPLQSLQEAVLRQHLAMGTLTMNLLKAHPELLTGGATDSLDPADSLGTPPGFDPTDPGTW